MLRKWIPDTICLITHVLSTQRSRKTGEREGVRIDCLVIDGSEMIIQSVPEREGRWTGLEKRNGLININ